MKKLHKSDIKYYLQEGHLTKSFLDDTYVLDKVLLDYDNKVGNNPTYTKIESLYNWIHKYIKSTSDDELKRKLKFKRTAQEIWESGFVTGCTDWATIFATLARQIGIPTTLLHTAEYDWVKRLKNNENQSINKGHSFCECFYEGKWILVDPTFRRIEYEYNPDKLVLNYKVSNSNVYIPYFRDLDLGKKQTMRDHNLEMNQECLNIEL